MKSQLSTLKLSFILVVTLCTLFRRHLSVQAKPHMARPFNVTGDLCTDCVHFFDNLKPIVDVLYGIANGTTFTFGLKRAILVQCSNIFINNTPDSSQALSKENVESASNERVIQSADRTETLCHHLTDRNMNNLNEIVMQNQGLVGRNACEVLEICSNY